MLEALCSGSAAHTLHDERFDIDPVSEGNLNLNLNYYYYYYYYDY